MEGGLKMRQSNRYSVIVFFENEKPKKWQYVDKLSSIKIHLDKEHSKWLYMNVYMRKTRAFLKRLKNSDYIPDYI